MSARLLYSLSDETPDLHKQFGCMSRIFQVFCRQSLSGSKISGLSHYSLPTDLRDNLRRERHSSMHKTVERDLKNSTKEKHRVSTDSSSRPSFSSSPRSSSFSFSDMLFSQREIRQDANTDLPKSTYSDSTMHLSQLPNSANSRVAKEFTEPETNSSRSREETKSTSGQKSFLKSKELPRLSIDSRENSTNNVRTEKHRIRGRSTPSIVAKLMGMEVPTDSTQHESNQTMQVKISQEFHKNYVSRSAVTSDDHKKIRFCDSPRPRTANSTKKTSAASKLPDGANDQTSSPKTQKEAQSSSYPAYGDIQKRLAKLEFKKPGKDLRALEQILYATDKTQKKSPTRKDHGLGSASMVGTNKPANYRFSDELQDSGSALNLNDGSCRSHKIRTGKNSILRQTDTVENETAMEETSSSRLLRSNQGYGDMSKSGRSQNRSNPKMQRKKVGLDKQSRKIQREQTELISSNENPRRESSIINSDQRDLNFKTNSRSLRYISNMISIPDFDDQATNRFRVDENNYKHEHTPRLQNSDLRFSRQGKMSEPSPVSRVPEEVAVGYENPKWMNLETTDEPLIAMPCDARNPDHRYISEISSASERLREPGIRKPHDDNFFVLERRNRGDIIRRKLVFDTVNEILARKFHSKSSSNIRITRGERILQSFCSEIDRVQANNSKCSFDEGENMISGDSSHQGVSNSDFETEVPELVLNIEKLIFKDLIVEAVTGLVISPRRRKKVSIN